MAEICFGNILQSNSHQECALFLKGYCCVDLMHILEKKTRLHSNILMTAVETMLGFGLWLFFHCQLLLKKYPWFNSGVWGWPVGTPNQYIKKKKKNMFGIGDMINYYSSAKNFTSTFPEVLLQIAIIIVFSKDLTSLLEIFAHNQWSAGVFWSHLLIFIQCLYK